MQYESLSCQPYGNAFACTVISMTMRCLLHMSNPRSVQAALNNTTHGVRSAKLSFAASQMVKSRAVKSGHHRPSCKERTQVSGHVRAKRRQIQTSPRPWLPAAAARPHQHGTLVVGSEPVDAVKPAESMHPWNAAGAADIRHLC